MKAVLLGLLSLLVSISSNIALADDLWISDKNGCKVNNPNPVAVERVTWSGACENGYANGFGILQLYKAEVMVHRYEGNVVNGIKEGQGKEYYSNGSCYEGNFVNGKREGQGKTYFPNGNGDGYEGNFVNDKIEGQGKYYTASGDRYEGEFRDYSIYNGVAIIQGKRLKYINGISHSDIYGFGNLDPAIAIDIVMKKITDKIKVEKYAEALPDFEYLESNSSSLPESFYFYYTQALDKAGKRDRAHTYAVDYLKRYGRNGKYYDQIVTIMSK